MAHELKKSTYGAGPCIVLLHGWGLNSGVWQPIIKQLEAKFEIITVDLPGFGLNHQTVPQPYTLETIGQLVVEAVNKPAIYVGWSLGGLVASHIALAYPQKCSALVTVASTPKFKQGEHWPGIKAEFLAAFYQQLSKDIALTLNSFLKIQAMGSPNIRQDLKTIQSLIMAYPLPVAEALEAGLDLLDVSDLRAQLGDISLPFLRIYGKLDSLVPKAAIEKINELCPNSELLIFDKASHAPFISHPQEFVCMLEQWLDKIKDSEAF